MTKNSTNDGRHPYLRADKWLRPEYHFWENGNYTEQTKEHYRAWLARLQKEDKRLLQETKSRFHFTR